MGVSAFRNMGRSKQNIQPIGGGAPEEQRPGLPSLSLSLSKPVAFTMLALAQLNFEALRKCLLRGVPAPEFRSACISFAHRRHMGRDDGDMGIGV